MRRSVLAISSRLPLLLRGATCCLRARRRSFSAGPQLASSALLTTQMAFARLIADSPLGLRATGCCCGGGAERRESQRAAFETGYPYLRCRAVPVRRRTNGSSSSPTRRPLPSKIPLAGPGIWRGFLAGRSGGCKLEVGSDPGRATFSSASERVVGRLVS